MIIGMTAKIIWENFFKEHGRIPTRKEFKEIGYSDRTYYRLKNTWIEEAQIKLDEEKAKKLLSFDANQ